MATTRFPGPDVQMTRQTFSTRPDIEILIEEEHEDSSARRIMAAAIHNALDLDVSVEALYDLICFEVDVIPNYDVDEETEQIPVWHRLLYIARQCYWYEVYDVLEALSRRINDLAESSYGGYGSTREIFEEMMNKSFLRYKSNWYISGSKVKKKSLSADKKVSAAPNKSLAREADSNDDDDDDDDDKERCSDSRTIEIELLTGASEKDKPIEGGLSKIEKEIKSLARSWNGTYRQTYVSSIDIKDWLDQFELAEQPLMFKLLKHLKFFGPTLCYEETRCLQASILEVLNLADADLDKGPAEIVLCALDNNPAKSSYTLSRIFHQANQMPRKSVVLGANLEKELTQRKGLKALVLVDDLLGSGETSIKQLKFLNEKHGEKLHSSGVTVVIGAICASTEAIQKVEEAIKSTKFSVRLVANHRLEKCFSEESGIFESAEEMQQAKNAATRVGKLLSSGHPLGHSDSQLLVVFHDNCPNNTLPILWCEREADPEWHALFERISS